MAKSEKWLRPLGGRSAGDVIQEGYTGIFHCICYAVFSKVICGNSSIACRGGGGSSRALLRSLAMNKNRDEVVAGERGGSQGKLFLFLKGYVWCWWKRFIGEAEVEVAGEKSVIDKDLGKDSKMGIIFLW